jgi:hypothetical protein
MPILTRTILVNDIEEIIFKVGSSFYLSQEYKDYVIFMAHWR